MHVTGKRTRRRRALPVHLRDHWSRLVAAAWPAHECMSSPFPPPPLLHLLGGERRFWREHRSKSAVNWTHETCLHLGLLASAGHYGSTAAGSCDAGKAAVSAACFSPSPFSNDSPRPGAAPDGDRDAHTAGDRWTGCGRQRSQSGFDAGS